MANKKTDSSNSPRSDDPVHPTNGGLSAKPKTASYPAGAEPGLDTLFHRTSLRFCCAANVVTASEAREPDVYRDCSNRLLYGYPRGGPSMLRGLVGRKCGMVSDGAGTRAQYSSL